MHKIRLRLKNATHDLQLTIEITQAFDTIIPVVCREGGELCLRERQGNANNQPLSTTHS